MKKIDADAMIRDQHDVSSICHNFIRDLTIAGAEKNFIGEKSRSRSGVFLRWDHIWHDLHDSTEEV